MASPTKSRLSIIQKVSVCLFIMAMLTGDGYGKLLGWSDGKIKKSTGWGNWCWGGSVRKATQEEIELFMTQLMAQDTIGYY